MLLLKHENDQLIKEALPDLHFTMLLLKLMISLRIKPTYLRFTFHYASIKTRPRGQRCNTGRYLHFTMLLLKPRFLVSNANNLTVFTFHYASIKT